MLFAKYTAKIVPKHKSVENIYPFAKNTVLNVVLKLLLEIMCRVQFGVCSFCCFDAFKRR